MSAGQIIRVRRLGVHLWLGLLVAAATQVAGAQPATQPAAQPAAHQATGQPAAVLELSPGTTYDQRVPTLKQVLGYDFGEEITPPDRLLAYLQALAASAPERTRLLEYARTYEGRPLNVFVIGSPERIAQLDGVKQRLRRLADPRGLAPAEAESLIRELPAVVWLIHAVHGNEISSSDAALAEAYHLLAAQNDPKVPAILRDAVVMIDPLQNPDGRARFVFQNLLGRARQPDAAREAAEHDEPWPGGRSNHYLFDMNRDWFSQSQPETRGRTRLFLEWFPHVVVDLHEMGGDSTYYFAPPADPLNPYITKAQISWFEAFGRENARQFDARGFAYFNRELYDSFYPGYGESWPIFHGAVGMTYEQASARGLVWRREDDAMLTYRDGIVHHFTAAIATAHTAAVNREKLLRDFLQYRQSAISDGETGPVREYLLPPGVDPSRTVRLAELLVSQGFDVLRAEEAITVGKAVLPAGTFVVPLAQPASRLVRNLLQPDVPQPDAFVSEQDRRRKRRLGDQIYDVTAWSLPLAFDVEVLSSPTVTKVKTTRVSPPGASPGATTLPAATVGYLLPWGSATAGAVAEALAAGLRIRTADAAFTLNGREFPGGTAIVRGSDNGSDLAGRLAPLVTKHRVEAVPIDSAFTDRGISLGSSQVVSLKAPRVLLAWDSPTSALSAGWARWVLERRFGQPATAVRVATLPRVALEKYDVIVFPSGNYSVLSADMVRRLKDWVNAGGTLVALAEAARWAARENVNLLETRTELRDGRPDVDPGDEEKKGESAAKPFDYDKAIQPERERPEFTPGAMLRVRLDRTHWLSSGTDGEIQTIVEGNRVFQPLRLDKGRNVGIYEAKDRLVVGGLAWPEAREQLSRKAFLMHQEIGQGHIVAFAEDPNFRAFAEATELLFINAVLLGPAH